MKKNNQSGFTSIVIIGGLLVGIVILSALSFYMLKSKEKQLDRVSKQSPSPTAVGKSTMPVPTSGTPAVEVSVISEKTDTATIQKELDSTDLDSIDSDLNSLDSMSDSL